MEAETRADILNDFEDIAEQYGYDVAGYNDDGEFFEILLLKREK